MSDPDAVQAFLNTPSAGGLPEPHTPINWVLNRDRWTVTVWMEERGLGEEYGVELDESDLFDLLAAVQDYDPS